MEARMLDTLTVPRDEDDFNTLAHCRPDPGGFLTGGAHLAHAKPPPT